MITIWPLGEKKKKQKQKLPLIRETGFVKGVKRSKAWALRLVLQKQVRAVWLLSEALSSLKQVGCDSCSGLSSKQLLPLFRVFQSFSV